MGVEMKSEIKIIIAVIVIAIIALWFLARKEYKIISADALEAKAKAEILAYKYDKVTRGKIWDRTVKVEITNVNVKLIQGGRVRITDCSFDIFWKEGVFPIKWHPVLSGEGNIVQQGDTLYVQDIYLDKTSVATDKYSINKKISEFANHLLRDKSFAILKDEKLSAAKIRFAEDGIYAKLDL